MQEPLKALKLLLKRKNFQKVGKEVFKFPISAVRKPEKDGDDSIQTSFLSSSSSSDDYHRKETEKDEETTWCTFEDFCKYHKDGRGYNLTENIKKANWNAYVKRQAFKLINDVEKYQARHR